MGIFKTKLKIFNNVSNLFLIFCLIKIQKTLFIKIQL